MRNRSFSKNKIPFLFLPVILAGLFLGVYLVQKQVNLRSRAALTILTVCPETDLCEYRGGVGLQNALFAAPDNSKIFIKNGVYTKKVASGKVKQLPTGTAQKDANGNCIAQEYDTTFILQDKNKVTIEGESAGQTVILGGPFVHNLSLVNSRDISISNLTLAHVGNEWDNGIGDASLNVYNSTGKIYDTIVTAKKTPGNKAQIDQEGIFLEGPETYFEIYNNLIIDNFHTGIMMGDGANAKITKNYIRNNGIDNNRFNNIGHAITTHDSGYSGCPNVSENFGLKAWTNIIYNNSGNGFLIRAEFSPKTYNGVYQKQIYISHNSIKGTQSGIIIGSSQKPTKVEKGAQLIIHSNNIMPTSPGEYGITYGGGHKYGIQIYPNVVVDNSSLLRVNNNNALGATIANYSLIPKAENIANLSLVPKRDMYFCLKRVGVNECQMTWNENSPLLGKGNNNTDISSYSSLRDEDEFEVRIMKNLYGITGPNQPDNPNLEPTAGSEYYNLQKIFSSL